MSTETKHYRPGYIYLKTPITVAFHWFERGEDGKPNIHHKEVVTTSCLSALSCKPVNAGAIEGFSLWDGTDTAFYTSDIEDERKPIGVVATVCAYVDEKGDSADVESETFSQPMFIPFNNIALITYDAE